MGQLGCTRKKESKINLCNALLPVHPLEIVARQRWPGCLQAPPLLKKFSWERSSLSFQLCTCSLVFSGVLRTSFGSTNACKNDWGGGETQPVYVVTPTCVGLKPGHCCARFLSKHFCLCGASGGCVHKQHFHSVHAFFFYEPVAQELKRALIWVRPPLKLERRIWWKKTEGLRKVVN